jgi:hypothetical protein
MTKNIFFFLVSIIVGVQILSAASDKSKIEITAQHVDAAKNIVKAKGNVVVYYEDSVMKASSAHFDKSTKVLVTKEVKYIPIILKFIQIQKRSRLMNSFLSVKMMCGSFQMMHIKKKASIL